MEKYTMEDMIFILVNNEGYIGPLKTQGPIVSPVKVTVKTAKNLVVGGYRVHQYDKETGKIIKLTEMNVMDKNKFAVGEAEDTNYKPASSDDKQKQIDESSEKNIVDQANVEPPAPAEDNKKVSDESLETKNEGDASNTQVEKTEGANTNTETAEKAEAKPADVTNSEKKNENNKNQKPWKNKK